MAKHSRSVPVGDHPTRHPLSHHSDHSGAHVRATRHHEMHADTTDDGHLPVGKGAHRNVHGGKGPNNPFVEGSPAEEASESPQEEAAEQGANIGGANPDEAMG